MKYKFTKIDDDTTELSYKDKKFKVKRDIELLKAIDSISFDAYMKMMANLKKRDMTVNDLIVIKKQGNKTYEDRSNLIELQNQYSEQMKLQLYEDFSKKHFNMSLDELALDIGLTEEDSYQFGMDLATMIKGEEKTPSQTENI